MRARTLVTLVLASSLVACASAVVPPILLTSGKLVYPESQMQAAVEGEVLVTYDIDSNGVVSNVRVVESDASAGFGDAAVRFVQTWRFQPQKRSGVPEAVYGIQSRISFVLDSGEAPAYMDSLKQELP